MYNRKLILFSLAAVVIFIAACTRYEYTPAGNVPGVTSITCPDGKVVNCEPPQSVQPAAGQTPTGNVVTEPSGSEATPETGASEAMIAPISEDKADVVVKEGDLVVLKPKVKDAEGDALKLTYTPPVDANGEWQTKAGDAGTYKVTVTASDGQGEAKKDLIILVKPKNAAPVIDIAPEITVNEGDEVSLQPVVTDLENETVKVSYSGWMTSDSYQTTYDDAGEHVVTITATDGISVSTKDVKIIVNNVNRKPVLKIPNAPKGSLSVTEGDLVEIQTEASDPDGDPVAVTFSEPLNIKGEWQTRIGDAGERVVNITATDGKDQTMQQVLIKVAPQNRPPVIDSVAVSPSDNIQLMKPGDTATIKIDVKYSDPDNDPLTVTYSGWMDSDTKVVSWGNDGGQHKVVITVSDGNLSVTAERTISVNSWPVFE